MRQLVSRRRHRLGVAALVGLLGWVGLGEQSHGQSGAGGIRLAVYYGPVNCPGRERGPRECLQRPVRAKVAIRAQGADAPRP